MKTPVLWSISAFAWLLCGCNAFTRPQATQVVLPGEPRPVAQVATNLVQSVHVEDAVGAIVRRTNTVPVLVTNTVLVPGPERVVVVTNFVPRDWTVAGVEVARTANGLLNPTPVAPMVNWGLGAITLLATGIAAWQNKRAGTSGAVAENLVAGIETWANDGLPLLKNHLANAATHAGPDVKAAVASTVAKVTT